MYNNNGQDSRKWLWELEGLVRFSVGLCQTFWWSYLYWSEFLQELAALAKLSEGVCRIGQSFWRSKVTNFCPVGVNRISPVFYKTGWDPSNVPIEVGGISQTFCNVGLDMLGQISWRDLVKLSLGVYGIDPFFFLFFRSGQDQTCRSERDWDWSHFYSGGVGGIGKMLCSAEVGGFSQTYFLFFRSGWDRPNFLFCRSGWNWSNF